MQARKAVKIAYALRFANLDDFVFLPAPHGRGVRSGDWHEVAYLAQAGDVPRVFADAGYGINLYDDPTT